MKNKAVKISQSLFALAAAMGLLIFPTAASQAVRQSVDDCLETVVPSLFSFSILAIWLQKSGVYRYSLRFLTFFLSKLLRMDEELCAVFVLANIGGYPTGIKLLSELVKSGRLSEKDAGRMLCCCFGSGPSFIIGIVGVGVFHSAKAGLVLFAACFASSLVMAVVVRLGGEIRLSGKNAVCGKENAAQCFVSSVSDGAGVMLSVCAMITAFSAVTALLEKAGLFAAAQHFGANTGVLSAVLEITRISKVAVTEYAMPLCAALLSFGGVCVQLQLCAVGGGIPLLRLWLSRIPAMIISAVLVMPFNGKFSAADVPVSAITANVEFFSANSIVSACVVLMCVIVIIEAEKCRY